MRNISINKNYRLFSSHYGSRRYIDYCRVDFDYRVIDNNRWSFVVLYTVLRIFISKFILNNLTSEGVFYLLINTKSAPVKRARPVIHSRAKIFDFSFQDARLCQKLLR